MKRQKISELGKSVLSFVSQRPSASPSEGFGIERVRLGTFKKSQV